jgi:hypothetical protein
MHGLSSTVRPCGGYRRIRTFQSYESKTHCSRVAAHPKVNTESSEFESIEYMLAWPPRPEARFRTERRVL